jgi:hypothetical protein
MDAKAYLIELGYSAEDATTLASDTKTVKAIEAAANQFESGKKAQEAAELARTETQTQKNELDKWWKETAQPAILNADGGTAAARAEAARYKEYIKTLKERGYPELDEMLKETTVTPTVTPNNAPQFDAQKAAVEMAQATARLYDLGSEYQELYGSPLPGAYNLLEEARTNGKPLTDYVRNKFNFDAKRTEISTKKESDRVAAITKDITERLEADYAKKANPMLAPAITSRAAAVVEAAGENKDSWKTKQGRNEAKKDRLLQFRNVLKTA